MTGNQRSQREPTYADRGRTLLRRYRGIIDQGIWVVLGQVSTGALTLAGTRLVTQFVIPELYGTVNLAQNALVLLRTLFCSPALNAGLRFYPDADRSGYLKSFVSSMRRVLLRSAIAMEVLAVAGGLVWSFRTAVHWWVAVILSVFVVADVIRTLEMSLFNAARRQRPAALFSAVETLLRPLLMVGAALAFGATVEVLLGAIAASIVCTLALIHMTARSPAVRDVAPMPSGLQGEMWHYALPLIPIAVLNWTTSVSDRYIIEWVTRDLSGLGVYAAGYGLISQPFLLIHGVVALTLRPVYFSAVSRGDHAHARRTFRVWLIASAAICAFACLLICVGRLPIVSVFLSARYREAAQYVPWIALGYVFYVMEQVLEQPLLAYKQTRSVLLAQASGAAASILVTVPFVMRWGTSGAAYACPIYFLIQAAVVALLVRGPRLAGTKADSGGNERTRA